MNFPGAILATLVVLSAPAWADPPATSVEVLLDTDLTTVGQAFAYPAGRARITAARLTVPPGATVPLHLHPVPLFVYILQGEIVVDYGSLGTRTYRKGDTFVEAIEWPHHARNGGRGNVELLAVYAGAEGVLTSMPLE
jgi:quercetin dioxygenase-like cupin family protein